MTDDELFADIPHPADGASPDAVVDPFTRNGASPFAEGLNPDQLDAVAHESGPLLVIAGAGSGKTRVLTHRIAHLIHNGVHPSKILAITFTNKAAAEMRERVGALVGPVVKTMWVSTFHSACVRILRANADALGYPRQFSIYDAADSNRLTSYEERADRPRRGTASRPEHLRPQARRRLRRVPGPPPQGRRDGLRRPADQHRQAVP